MEVFFSWVCGQSMPAFLWAKGDNIAWAGGNGTLFPHPGSDKSFLFFSPSLSFPEF